MISSEAQRTLVKSPPELWAEISDPESLARHLGEFGEIRITRVQPEQKVEWEARDASGTVVIKPSGWGTKVKLTVKREVSLDAGDATRAADGGAADGAAIDGAATDGAATDGETEPSSCDGDDEAAVESPLVEVGDTGPADGPATAPDAEREPVDAEREPERDAPDEQAQPIVEREPRRGFFARLFGRRRASAAAAPARHETAPGAAAAQSADAELDTADADIERDEHVDRAEGHERAATPPAGEHERVATPDAEGDGDGDGRDLAAELKAAEEVAAEQVAAVLTSVLDRLGAAHHRPFSRP